MKKSLIGLAALAGIGMSLGQSGATLARSVEPTPPRRRQTARRSKAVSRGKISSAHFYPEQSNRQAMRGLRRAQGGPGIVLVDGFYEDRRTAV